MKKNKKTKLLLIGLAVFVLFVGGLNFAQGLEISYPTIPGTPSLSENPLLPEYVRYLYNFSIMIAGLIAFVSLVYGGFRYIISVGNPVAMTDAREQIGAGITGLIILLGSYLLLVTVNPQLSMLKVEKIPPPAHESCDCSQPLTSLSIFCQKFCRGVVVETKAYEEQEVPIGTIIEFYLLKEDLIDRVRTETEKTRQLSEEVKNLSKELNDLLKNGCKCSNTDPTGCGTGCSDGDCEGEVCNNLVLISLKKAEVLDASSRLENQLAVVYGVTSDYRKELLRLILAKRLLEEGLFPVNYDNLLEIKQDVFQTGGDIKILPLDILGGTIIARQDPANFYFDVPANQDLLEAIKSMSSESYNFPFPAPSPPGDPPPPGGGIPPPIGPPPPPPDPGPGGEVVLNLPSYLQGDPTWGSQLIDDCSSCTFAPAGCGITSTAIVLQFFGKNVNPSDVSSQISRGVEYLCEDVAYCSCCSVLSNLVQFMSSNYGLNYQSVSLSVADMQAQTRAGHPIIGSFNCWGMPIRCIGHISVISGVETCTIGGVTDTCVYFQDPYIGASVFFADNVLSNFGINILYAISP